MFIVATNLSPDFRFAMEIHMVHFNSKYGSYAKALKKNDGLAVLTIFAEVIKIQAKFNK